MSSDVEMLIKLLNGERGNQSQYDPVVPLLMRFWANLISIMRGLAGCAVSTHSPLSSRHFGPTQATSRVFSRHFRHPKALGSRYS